MWLINKFKFNIEELKIIQFALYKYIDNLRNDSDEMEKTQEIVRKIAYKIGL